MTRLLIEYKANALDVSNERLQRPIHWAATKGHVDVVKLIRRLLILDSKLLFKTFILKLIKEKI